VRWDSFAESSEFVGSGENDDDVADFAGSATPKYVPGAFIGMLEGRNFGKLIRVLG
jgi:NADPH-dependent curcumin reductase CurA